MIKRIGVIYQDATSLGFLHGLRKRLGCEAELVKPPAAIGRQRRIQHKKALDAVRYFEKNQVDLIVRFTDADRDPWRRIREAELAEVARTAHTPVVCGVAVNSPEEWLALDPEYLAGKLGFDVRDLRAASNRTGFVKHALAKTAGGKEPMPNLVQRLVEEAGADVFGRWLRDDALREFYRDCHGAAMVAGCERPDESRGSS